MDITFVCDKCGQQIAIDEAGAGLQVQCPKCGHSLTVPVISRVPNPTPSIVFVPPPPATEPAKSKTVSPLRKILGGVFVMIILGAFLAYQYRGRLTSYNKTDWNSLPLDEVKKRAEANDRAAQSTLGYRYGSGLGVPKDDAAAVKWFRKAAEQGNADGQKNLGTMYANGLGVAKDEAEAVKWYRKAAEQGNAYGQKNLGWMYENGLGVAKDEAEAVKWFRKAAEQGVH